MQRKHNRPQYFQRSYNQLQSKLNGLLAHEPEVRSKRSIPLSPRHHHRQIYKKSPSTNRHRWGAIAPALLRIKRSSHAGVDQQFTRTVGNVMHRSQRNKHIDPHEAAYMKYYEKIKQKHRNYISNLLRAHQTNGSSFHNIDRPAMHAGTSMSRLLHNTANDNELHRNEDMHHRQEETSPAEAVFHELNVLASLPIPLPNINENMRTVMHHTQPFVNNTYVGRTWNRDQNNGAYYFGASRRVSDQKNSTAVRELYYIVRKTNKKF